MSIANRIILSRLLLWAGWALLITVSTGCNGDSCNRNADCTNGEMCVNGDCRQQVSTGNPLSDTDHLSAEPADTANANITDTVDSGIIDDSGIADTDDTSVLEPSDTADTDTSDTGDTSVLEPSDTADTDTSDTSAMDTTGVDTGDTAIGDTTDSVADVVPPGRIDDLTVLYSGTADTVTVSFTAPGDDDITGTASAYLCKISQTPIGDAQFASADDVAEAATWVPLQAGTKETHTIALPWYSGTYYLAIKAVDEAGNQSTISPQVTVDTGESATLSQTSADFGDVAFHRSSALSFTLTNSSTLVDLVITNVTTQTSGDFILSGGEFTGSNITLPPGEFIRQDVTFTPSQVGVANETLRFFTQHGGPYALTMIGNGINLGPSGANLTLTDSPATVGTPVTLSLQVSDPNSDLPGYDDIASVTADLTSVGGLENESLDPSLVDATTMDYQTQIDTSALTQGAYLINVTVIDKTGASVSLRTTLLLYTGSILTVGPSESMTTIQEAIDLAVDGDVVLVRAPALSYTGPGNKNLHTDGKKIIVASEDGPQSTIIDCQNSQSAINLNDSGETPDTAFVGFTFQNCGAAAVKCVSTTTDVRPSILNCVFKDNTAGTDGGALLLDGARSSVNIQGCTFENNTLPSGNPGYNGGAIAVVNGAQLHIWNSHFKNNSAKDGGAIYVKGSNSEVHNCVFTNNDASTSYGGAIMLDAGDHVVDNVQMTDNTAKKSGGGIYLTTTVNGETASLTVNDSTFTNNTNRAIYVAKNSATLLVDNTQFDQNLDGAVSSAGILTVTDTTFRDNRAGTSGGAAILATETATVIDSTFTGNIATGQGGAITASKSLTVAVNNNSCAFTDNQGTKGGAIYINAGNTSSSIEDCTFSGNIATTVGGAINLNAGDLLLTDCRLANNQLNNAGKIDTKSCGGAVAVSGGVLEATDLQVFGNHSNQYGGGLCATGRSALTLTNLLVVDNIAELSGGGISIAQDYNVASNFAASFLTVSDNLTTVSGGGGIYVDTGVGVIANSIIAGNDDGPTSISDSGDDLFIESFNGADFTIDYTLFIYGDVPNVHDSSAYINAGLGIKQNNVFGDPLFAIGTGPVGGYYLTQIATGGATDSPAVDAGSRNATFLDGTTRIDLIDDTGLVDMGYHY